MSSALSSLYCALCSLHSTVTVRRHSWRHHLLCALCSVARGPLARAPSRARPVRQLRHAARALGRRAHRAAACHRLRARHVHSRALQPARGAPRPHPFYFYFYFHSLHSRPLPVAVTVTLDAASMMPLCSVLSQRNLLCALSHDRSVLLVDVRERLPLRRLVLRMRSNALAWSPTRAFNLTLANEDYKCAHLLCADL